MYVLSSNLRSFSFSWPSAEVQSPSSLSCTFRVGPDVIGTSYWQALKARVQRPITTPTRSQAEFDELTKPCSPPGSGPRRNRSGLECTECRRDLRFPPLFSVVRASA